MTRPSLVRNVSVMSRTRVLVARVLVAILAVVPLAVVTVAGLSDGDPVVPVETAAASSPDRVEPVPTGSPPVVWSIDASDVWYVQASRPPPRVVQVDTPVRRRPRVNLGTDPGIVADSGSLAPCGGDLPPCWVKARESHGNYGAVNSSGCRWTDKSGTVHVGCFGAWQFGTMWAGRLGLPDDLSTATPAQQDAAARELWAGGRGCGNWGAC